MIPRFIHSNMVGAPVGNTVPGAYMAIADAVLRTGFNIKTPNSVAVASGVATFTYLAAHGYEDKCWLRIAGAGAAALNADLQCAVPNSTTFTVPAVGVPDGPVSGTIESRVAPLGWDRPFSDTNVAVYRSPNIAGTRLFWRLDDTNVGGNTMLRVRGYESMTGVSEAAGTDPFPTVAQRATGVQVIKGTATPWAFAADDRTVYWYTGSVPQGANYQGVSVFGDFDSYKPADPFAALCGGNDSNSSGYLSSAGGQAMHFVARAANALQKSGLYGHIGPSPGQSGLNRPYPNNVTGGATFDRPMKMLDGDSSTSSVRGVLRGVMFVHEAMPAFPWVVVPAATGVNGRVVVFPDGSGSVAFPVDEAW